MRIISGISRGTRLKTLDGEDTRPTLERVKEAMFSAVQFILPGAQVLDLYAGSGQLGLEALSRGAVHCTFVDTSREACECVTLNAQQAGLLGQSKVVRSSADAFVGRNTDQLYDIILLDPPYRQDVLPGLLPFLAPLCNPGAVVLCESEARLALPQKAEGLVLQKQYKYGTVRVSRYALRPSEEIE